MEIKKDKRLRKWCENMIEKTVNIAVIVSGIDEEYQNTILTGIQKFGNEKGINIFHFISYGGILKSQTYDVGEFNIYELVNYSKFDGVILLTNTIESPTIARRIIENVKEAGIPAVSVDNNLKDFYCIGIDNYSAMEGMVEHIVCHHKLKRINYVSGPMDNPESALRLKAYTEVLGRNGIEIEEERIFHGLFRGEDGRTAVHKFLKSDLEFPEAIICANDAMALSAVIELEKAGINVPGDVLVTGFDSIYAAQNYSPKISSVTRPLKQSGYLACKIIYDHINGRKHERINILPTEYVFAESCGCTNKTIDDISKFKKSNYRTIETYNIYTPMINRMSCELEECQTLEENVSVIKDFVQDIGCDSFFLCLCDDWSTEKCGFLNNFTVNGYTDQVIPVIAYVDGIFVEAETFDAKDMLPDLDSYGSRNSNYFFMPLHFRDHCLGYCVVCNSKFPMESILFHTWVMNISNSLENIRKIMSLDRMVKKLDQLFITDPLVQIYNRNGLNKFAKPMYEECIRRRADVMIMFIDMDNLKKINDKHGHEEGDEALKAIAKAMKSVCDLGKNQIPARFGGDEFIIIAADMTKEQAEKMERDISDYLDGMNQSSGKPYQVTVSTGFCIARAESEESFTKLISMADQVMYHNKKIKKLDNERDQAE